MNYIKKVTLIVASLALAVFTGTITHVSAASTSGTLNGYSVSATLNMGSSSASAFTSISGKAAATTVSLTYVVGLGTQEYTYSNNASGVSSTSVVVNSLQWGSVPLSATSRHGVYFDSYSWTPTLYE